MPGTPVISDTEPSAETPEMRALRERFVETIRNSDKLFGPTPTSIAVLAPDYDGPRVVKPGGDGNG